MMTTFNGIAVTDEINRYNQKFTLNAMYQSYTQQWSELLPCGINHNSEKDIGISKLTGIYIEPGKAYMTNSVSFADSKEEGEKILQHNYEYQYEHNVINHMDKYNALIDKIKGYIFGEYKLFWRNGVLVYNKGIVERLFPDLCANSQDGLLDIELLSPVLPGIYKKGDLLIFAHRYFRRGCSYLNSLNTAFLSRIEQVDKTTSSVKVAIDLDCIGLAGTEHEELEYQYWWGPKFNDDLNSIPLGVTVHENEHYNALTSEIKRTEFGWYIQDDKHTFECEEITDVANAVINGSMMYACRFVHSMVDKTTGIPIHLDGAIRAYSDESMIERLDIPINKCDRNTIYKKLWRIDGAIPIITWKELITHYYRDNMMIGEYFGGHDEKLTHEKSADGKPDKEGFSVDSFIPCNINSGDGIRVYFSFSNRFNDCGEYNISIRPCSYLIVNGESLKYFESETVPLFKHLKRKGFCVRLPNTKQVSFLDQVYNFPVFECQDIASANGVLASLSLFCDKWVEHGDDRLISFTIKVAYSDKVGAFSFLGHVVDFARFFSAGFNCLPAEEAIYDWLSGAYDYITQQFKNSSKIKPFDTIIAPGIIGIKRQFIDPKFIQTFCDEKGACLLSLSEEEMSFVISNRITAAMVFVDENRKCSKCHSDYLNCDCISILDDGVVEIIEKGTPLGLVWTNRSAITA